MDVYWRKQTIIRMKHMRRHERMKVEDFMRIHGASWLNGTRDPLGDSAWIKVRPIRVGDEYSVRRR